MDHHESQKQHRVPQVYLKQFGFEKDKIWYITIFDHAKNHTEDVSIKEFNYAINEFDLPSHDYKEKRHFELTAGKIEGMYKMVLNSIKNQRLLKQKHEDILRHFSSSLIVRSERHRSFFSEMLGDQKVRDRFLEEVTLFDKTNTPEDIKLAFSVLDSSMHLPLIQGILANHLVRVFRSFNAIILKDFDNRGWFTSDDPVCIDYQDNYSWLIPPEAEIYLPLSRELCLFLYNDHVQTKNTNPLRKLKINKIHPLNEYTHDTITKKIILNRNKSLIVPPKFRMYFFD
jgi:hypothetical protein